MRVLFADDDADTRKLAARAVLQELPQAQVVEASDRRSLSEALAAGRIDILISDYDLRWMDGFEVFALTREAHPDCVAVMFTGTGNEELAVRAMKSGFDDYVVKNPGQLKRMASSARLAFERQAERRLLRENRELMRKELYHRLHNNLQIVVSLMGLTARAMEDPVATSLVRDLMRRVQSLSLLQERFYRGEDLRHINISAFIAELVSDANGGASTVRVTTNLEPLDVPVDQAVPLALIANEMLMEADRSYSGAAPSSLEMSLRRTEGRVILGVSSQGSNLREVSQAKLGMDLIRRLAGQIGASVEHEAKDSRVTTRVAFAG
jgi:two-component sensor histidine kinase